MRFFRFGLAMGIAMLPDAAFGVLVVHCLGRVFLCSIPPYFYLIGIFLALLPDIDTPLMWIVKRRHISIHQLGTHYPLVVIVAICIPLVILSVIWPILGYWALVAFICLLFHYIHDSIGKEVGEKWLWPIDKEHYHKFGVKKDGKWRIFVGLTEEEIKVRTFEEWARDELSLSRDLIVGLILAVTAGLLIALVLKF